MIVVDILAYIALSIVAVAFIWWGGYALLRYFDYNIVKDDEDEDTDTAGSIIE